MCRVFSRAHCSPLVQILKRRRCPKIDRLGNPLWDGAFSGTACRVEVLALQFLYCPSSDECHFRGEGHLTKKSELGSYGQFCPVAMAAEIVCSRWIALCNKHPIVSRFGENTSVSAHM